MLQNIFEIQTSRMSKKIIIIYQLVPQRQLSAYILNMYMPTYYYAATYIYPMHTFYFIKSSHEFIS